MKPFSFLKTIFTLIFVGLLCVEGWGQVNISAGSTITQNFTIGTSATAPLPAGWKMDKNATVRLVGSYASAASATEQRAGNTMSSSVTNGIYNYAAGAEASATDRAVGGLSSSTASKSVNVYVQLTNNGAGEISNFTITYNVEKYRNGNNTAGFSIQMYYSTNGTSWTSAGSDFLTSFAADADNLGFASAPGATISVSNKTLSIALAASSSLYLAWNYSVTTGSTTSNAQALGIDDVSITANSGTSPSISVGSISGFGNQSVNTTSTYKTYNASGSYLTGNIVITAPTGFLVSLSSGSGYGSSVSLSPTSGTVASTPIYVTFNPSSITSYSGNISHTSSDATTQNVAVSGTGTLPANPATFTATTASTTQINLSATANTLGNNIVVVFNGTNTFTTPTDGVAAGNIGDAFAGGTIFYKGSAAGIGNHTGLSSSQLVYYKAFSVDALNFYSSGSSVNATTFKNEPTNHVSNFSSTQGSPTSTVLVTNWTDANVGVIPDGYLVKGSSVDYGSITDPADGITEATSTLVKTITQGTQTASFTGLSTGTTYYFKIFPFTNSGTNINYKTDGVIPTSTVATSTVSTASDYFRSKATGNWNATTSWESSADGNTWINATLTPTNAANTIAILTGHTITVTASVSADQLTINNGGKIIVNGSQTFTIGDGEATNDLIVNGTLENAGTVTTTGTATFGSTGYYKHTRNGGL